MAKKSKSPNIPEQTLARARAELYGNANILAPVEYDSESRGAALSKGVVKPTKGGYHATTLEDLQREYAHVLGDIRSMGLLALALFMGMVAAAFIIV